MVSITLFPLGYMTLIGSILDLIHPMKTDPIILKSISDTTVRISMYSLLLVGIICGIWLLRKAVLRKRSERIDATWGCGYVTPNSRQQYTGKSFSKPLGKIFNSILIEKKQFEELDRGELFPGKKSYISHYHDFFEHNLIKPITEKMVFSANYFSFVQNGRIQSYVLYGIVFMLAMVVLSILNVMA